MRGVLLALLFLPLACARYRDDVRTLCAAPPDETTLALDRAVATAKMKTDRGRALVSLLQAADVDPAAKLAAEAAKEGVAPCALAEAFVRARERSAYEHDVRMLCGYGLDEIADKDFQSEKGRALRDRMRPLEIDARRRLLASEANQLSFAGCAQSHP
ncbi:MAG: hypothetical protein ACXVEF_20745 [Polyangiales bacterium]